MRVLRVYHAGRDHAHRARERALAACGLDVTLVVPTMWPDSGAAERVWEESVRVVEVGVSRPGNVNRHLYAAEAVLRRVVVEAQPDVIDLHEEPFSVVAKQLIGTAPPALPIVAYTAQNVDKRYPPPFAGYERHAYRRVAALYPCSRQAASVARGKGFDGAIEVIPLGFEPEVFRPGRQSLDDDELLLVLVGRLVPEKGLRDAVQVLGRVARERPARLVIAGSGPEESPALRLAAKLGLADRVSIEPWRSAEGVAELLRHAHVALVPSLATETWTEQFGRVIVEAQASGAVVAGYASGAIPEVAGGAALLVEPGEVRALAGAVVRVCNDAGEYARRREHGLSLSATRTWAAVAARQRDLYARVLSGDVERMHLPASPRLRRAAARSEFGPTAPTSGGVRPFALPILRRGGVLGRSLGAVIDAAAEIRARAVG